MASTSMIQDEAVTRAAALLEAAPGMYTLRKRRRDSTQLADSSPRGTQSTQTQAAGSEGSTMGVLSDSRGHKGAGVPTATPAVQVNEPQTPAQLLSSKLSPVESRSPPNAAQDHAMSEDEVLAGDGDGDGDDSSLTSLSDLEERFNLIASPQPPRRNRGSKSLSNVKPPQKRKVPLSVASSPSTMSSATAASEYRPDETDHADDSSIASPRTMDVDSSAHGGPSPETGRKAPRTKQPPASRARRASASNKNPPTRRHEQPAPGAARQPDTLARVEPSHSAPAPAPAHRTQVNQVSQVVAPPQQPPVPRKKAPAKAFPVHQQAPPNTSIPAPTARTAAPHSRPVSVFTGVSRLTSDFRPGAMPSVMDLYERRQQVLQDARLEATRDPTLQRRSEEQIETAIHALDGGGQQTGLCLAMNRYSAFCALASVDVPPFPITAAKVALFLARSPSTALSTLLLSVFPQPATYPLPLAGIADPTLTDEEGSRVSRELVRFWVEALAYAQRATVDIWAPVLGSASSMQHDALSQPMMSQVHPSLQSLQDDVAIREIYGAVETSESIMRSEEQARQARQGQNAAVIEPQQATKGKTKWTKGGKSVAPPPSSSSSGRTTSSEQNITQKAVKGKAVRRPAPPPAPAASATQSVSRPVEYWQVTNAQASPVLPIASAPVTMPGQHAPVASTSRHALDPAHRRRNTTSDIGLVGPWDPVSGTSAHQQQDYQLAHNLPHPISIEDANALQGALSGQNLSPWAQQFLQQATNAPADSSRRHSRASTYAHDTQMMPWASQDPHVGAYGETSLPDTASYGIPFAIQQAAQSPFTDTSAAGYQDARAPARGSHRSTKANGTSQLSRTSTFDLLAAVANEYLPANMDPPLDGSHSVVPYSSTSSFPTPDMGGADLFSAVAASASMQGVTDHNQGGLQRPWTSSDSSCRGSQAEQPFDPSLHDPSLSDLLHTRYQPHAPAYIDSPSHYGRVDNSTLAGVAPYGPTASYGGGEIRPLSQPQHHPHAVRPSSYPTPDSPSIERWPPQLQYQQGSDAWSVPQAGIPSQHGAAGGGVYPALGAEAATVSGATLPGAYGLGLSYV
ncbi:hypothetical protein JCM10908_003385 [Rhodotorula pacifica]|uniref:uncharacterized protein n=1 Tax=Rhodotorula pacifica TaxID=1495444 RepID=UPI00316CA8F2